jgi:hypothetical protein
VLFFISLQLEGNLSGNFVCVKLYLENTGDRNIREAFSGEFDQNVVCNHFSKKRFPVASELRQYSVREIHTCLSGLLCFQLGMCEFDRQGFACKF